MHLGELVTRVAQEAPEQTAIYFGEQTLTYGQLDAAINRVANGLAKLGVGPGDRVALSMINRPEFVQAFYGTLRAGGTVVPLNVMYKPDEIAYILNDCAAKAYITLEPLYPAIGAARARVPSLEKVVVLGANEVPDTVSWRALVGGAAATPPGTAVKDDDVAVICYTSGTTGHPKGAMLSHANLLRNCGQCDQIPHMRTSPEDRVLLVLPMFHIYALNVGMNLSYYKGAATVIQERFDPAAALEAIERFSVTVFYGAPPMYIAWINHPKLRETDFGSLRAAFSGAAALPGQVLETFEKLSGVPIWEGYGLTEASPVVTSCSMAGRPIPNSIGLPIPEEEVKLVDDNGNEVPRGQPGELICRGPNIMLGYYNQPEATAEAIRDGWLYTGDIATQDENGFYYIVDRKKDMINVSGFNVYPREVEEVLYRHPKIADVAVIDYPDPYQGESVMAVVVPKPGETMTAEEIIAYSRERMANFKAPRHVVFRDSLPHNLSGKVLKRVLRDEIHAAART